MIVGLGLAQIGEFSFVLLEVGRGLGLVDQGIYQWFLSAALLTMVATPGLVAVAPRAAELWVGMLRLRGSSLPPPAVDRRGHVVIVGFGTNGCLLARVLDEAGIKYVVVELNPETVRQETRAGRPIVFGDSTRSEILEVAGVAHAAMVVFAISDYEAVRRSVRLARSLAPEVEIVVRTRMISEIESIRRAGADHVIAEEFETAIEIFTRVLERFHVPRNLIRAQTRLLRGEDYRVLRAPEMSAEAGRLAVDLLAAGTTELFRIEDGSRLVGHTLASLDLRRATGASVIAIVRGEHSWTSPPANLELETGDTLVLVGGHAEIERAVDLLGRSDSS